MAYQLEVKYFNSFVLRKTVQASAPQTGEWPGLPWEPQFIATTGVAVSYPQFPWGLPFGAAVPAEFTNWYLEGTRIKGGFNNSTMDLGVRAYAVNANRDKTDRSSSLIFSGVFNDRTGFNNTNVFSISENIIKDADPTHGSIQKLYSENTNLLILQENKVHYALINKSTIYSGTQGAEELMGTSKVIGQLVPFSGEYGISRNPESFATYGNRKYFTDKDRSAVIRLSSGVGGGDGITEISMYGMRNYFRDQLATINDDRTRRSVSKTGTLAAPGTYTTLTLPNITNIDIGSEIEVTYSVGGVTTTTSVVTDIPSTTTVTISPGYTVDATLGTITGFNFVTYRRDKNYGSWDMHQRNYTLSMQTEPRFISTADDSFDTLSFDENIKGWTSFYSYKPIFMGSLKNRFYTFINDEIYQQYVDNGSFTNRCIFYGGATPDEASVELIFNPSPSVKKNFQTIAYEGENGWEVESIKSGKQGFDSGIQYQDIASPISSYDEGAYTENGVTLRAGFDRKENRYVANIVNASTPRPGEVIFGTSMSGVKGYFTTVKFKIDSTTDVGGMKELFLAGTDYVMSSY
jgi:hypothetical protein